MTQTEKEPIRKSKQIQKKNDVKTNTDETVADTPTLGDELLEKEFERAIAAQELLEKDSSVDQSTEE